MGKKDTEQVLNAFFSTVQETLKQNDKVQIPGFGSFEVKERAERTGPAIPKTQSSPFVRPAEDAVLRLQGMKDAIK